MIGPANILHPFPAPHCKTFKVFLFCFSKYVRLYHSEY